MAKTILIPREIFTGETFLRDYAVVIENGRIAALLPKGALPPDTRTQRFQDLLLAPAFIDMQIYGGNGKMFSLFPSVESLTGTYEYAAAGGATHFMATVATNSPAIMEGAMKAVRAYWDQGLPGLLGLHLEGPYLNSAKKGAHLTRYLRTPTLDEVQDLVARAKGTLKMMTLAPECCDPDIIRYLMDAGVLVSAGHSDATYEEGMAGFRIGIPTATHLYNAMSPLGHRSPGLVGAVFDSTAYSSIIADGIHVSFPAIRIAKQLMGDRLFLITDAVTEAKTDSYTYILDGDRYVTENGTLAGSALTQAKSVQNLISREITTPAEALRMASLYPARVAGKDRELGRIAPGYAADLVLLDPAYDLVHTLSAGSILSFKS